MHWRRKWQTTTVFLPGESQAWGRTELDMIEVTQQQQQTEKSEEKEVKGTQIGKEVKLSLFVDNMILYTENPKDTIRKLLELINELDKVAGYKINTQKLDVFLYNNNVRSEREVKNKSHSLSHQKE